MNTAENIIKELNSFKMQIESANDDLDDAENAMKGVADEYAASNHRRNCK